jgi:hypothetical protein
MPNRFYVFNKELDSVKILNMLKAFGVHTVVMTYDYIDVQANRDLPNAVLQQILKLLNANRMESVRYELYGM